MPSIKIGDKLPKEYNEIIKKTNCYHNDELNDEISVFDCIYNRNKLDIFLNEEDTISIIISDNMLYYFTEEQRNGMIKKIENEIKENGLCVLKNISSSIDTYKYPVLTYFGAAGYISIRVVYNKYYLDVNNLFMTKLNENLISMIYYKVRTTAYIVLNFVDTGLVYSN